MDIWISVTWERSSKKLILQVVKPLESVQLVRVYDPAMLYPDHLDNYGDPEVVRFVADFNTYGSFYSVYGPESWSFLLFTMMTAKSYRLNFKGNQ